ncbi:dockerin type I repeat-containing protein [Ruminococcus sp.]|uniref:dockerin type I repeat-containing protein n=1 Tax=Ruminococcus sp. TaxID=41978 RepID=UPI00344D611E
MSKTKRIIAAVTAAIITATSYAAISVSAEDNGGSDHGFVSSSVSAQTDKNEAAVSNAQLYDKLGQLLKQGDSLKYGEALYTTGTPDGEKWTKDFYEQRVDFYGEEFLAKYIVDGEFLRDKVVSDMAEITTKENNSGLKATAEDINEYMRSNGISGFTYVRAVDGVEKIFITYDGFFEKIKAYVVDTGVDESLVVYQQSHDDAIISNTSDNDKNEEGNNLKVYAKDISDFMLRSGIAGDAFVRDDKVVVTYSAYEDKIKTYIREKGLDESVIVYESGKNVADTSEEDKKSTLKETAEDINEYMRLNGISGSTHVHEDDGIEKIFITYDGFLEKIKAYVVDTGVDESLVVYQQSQDHEAVIKVSYKIVSLPDKLEYKLGEQIDLTGIQIEMSKGDEKAVVYTYPDVAFDYQSDIPKSPSVVLSTDFRSDIAGTYTVKVTDSENASFTVKVVDIADSSDTESSLEEDAESINEYMRSNGISGFTYVRAIDGVEKIFITYDGFFEEIQAYVKEKGIDENLVVYQQSYDYNTNESTLKGDANCDGQIDLSDAVIIMQSLANPNKYGIDGTAEHHLTEQGKLNGDMNGDGLTVGDAQAIQKKLLGLDDTDSNQSSENEGNNNEAVVSQDVGFGQTWNGKPVSSELYTVFSKNKDVDAVIAISPQFKNNENYKYNGKTIAEYSEEVRSNNLLDEKLRQILKEGDELKYGELLCTTGTPDGIKWSQELYEQRVEFYGEEFLAKYILNGEFLKDKVEADIADFSTEPHTALAEAIKAYKKAMIQEAIEQLKEQNIKYDYSEASENLIINVTAEEFKDLSLENVSCYYIGTSTSSDDGFVSTVVANQ